MKLKFTFPLYFFTGQLETLQLSETGDGRQKCVHASLGSEGYRFQYIYLAKRVWILLAPNLRTIIADRRPLVGLLLDQQRRRSGAYFTRRHHRLDGDDPALGVATVSTARLLHQSHRRLDVRMHDVRLLGTHGVRAGQRFITKTPAPGSQERS